MHHLHTQVCAVDDVSPSVDDTSLRVDNGLVEVETVQVESHGGNTHGSQPNTENRPQGKEEVKCPRVVEGGVLKDETSKVAVGGDNVVGFFLLSEFVTCISRFVFGGFADQGRCHQRSVHGGEK